MLKAMLTVGMLLLVAGGAARAEPLVYNGSFDLVGEDGRPEGWDTSGLASIEQRLEAVQDPVRGRVARLLCTEFVPGSPASHAMVAQLDRFGVEQGQWYRVSLWARAAGIPGGVVSIALQNRRVWQTAGLSDSFVPGPEWKRFEFTFQASRDLSAGDARFQVWFGSTGTLWLDEVAAEPLADFRRAWWPQLPLEGVPNAIPNSSFECGGAGWGCWTGRYHTWGTELFRRLGEWDRGRAYHGDASWRLSISADEPHRVYFDYYEPVDHQVRSVLIGHEGWVPVERGRPYVFSAYVAADRPGTPVRVVVREAEGRNHARDFTVGTDWQRVELSITAERDFVCGFVGPDLTESDAPGATVWVDAVQWERGRAAGAYRPRRPAEAFFVPAEPDDAFITSGDRFVATLRAFNEGPQSLALRGEVKVTDFRDEVVGEEDVELELAPGASSPYAFGFGSDGPGFFRMTWTPEGGLPQRIRLALVEPQPEGESVFGMNHAFGQGFLLPLAHMAGLSVWRDWSAQWNVVQPAPDGFDFSVPDAQIDRVLEAGGRVLVLLPFPSAEWATTPDEEMMREAAGAQTWRLHRLPTAFKPRELGLWAGYVRATVEHYRGRVRSYEILNEPLYTTYALPQRFGYDLPDYLDLLRVAYRAAKEADPECTVLGGMGGPPDMDWQRRFIAEGGLELCDALSYHLYPHGGWPELYEDSFAERLAQMRELGQAKPIWMTEFGVYGDDDPAFTPAQVGDGTMNRALRPDELRAASDLVRFAAVFCAHGVRKIFYHAGTCHPLNQSNAENVFFEYGGRPRVQYAAQAALARLIGPDFEFVRKWDEPEGVEAYEFRSRRRTVVIVWSRSESPPTLDVPDGMQALDLMGSPLRREQVVPGDVPIYLVTR
jgi:hypothetical protein